MRDKVFRVAPILSFLVVLAFLSLFPNCAAELEERGLLQPAQRLGAFLGSAPGAADGLRLLVMDDASMAAQGRAPSLAEMINVAYRLFDQGFAQVIISGVSLENVGDLPTPRGLHGKTLAIGTVAFPLGASSVRAKHLQDVDGRFFLPASGVTTDLGVTASILAPQTLLAVDGLRFVLLNAETEYRVPAGMLDPKGRILPHLALLGSEDFVQAPVAWLEDTADRKLYVDFLSIEAALKVAAPLGPLLARDSATSSPSGLQGGKVALIVPDGHTGGRFVSSPFGTLPSYVALASLLSSAMQEKIILKPHLSWLYLCPFVLLLFGTIYFQRSMVGLSLGLLIVGLAYGTAVGTLIFYKKFLPGAEMTLAMAAVWLTGSLQMSVQTFAARVKLNFELAMGHDVQKLFLTEKTAWTFGRWQIHVTHRPFGALSGDWYQIFVPEENGPFAVVALGDVVGKGTSAALITAAVAAVWHGARDEWAQGRIDVHAFLRRLDVVIRRSFNNEQYTTLSLAVLMKDEAILVTCATQPWLLVEPNGNSTTIKSRPTSPVGNTTEPNFVDATVERSILPGEFLLAFTDGLIDGTMAREVIRKRLAVRGAATGTFDCAAIAEEILKPLPDRMIPMPDDATYVLMRLTVG